MPTHPSEPAGIALLLTTCGILLAVSVLFSRASQRIGVPIALLFLLVGMLAGSEGIGGIEFDDYRFAFRMGSLALALILFDGGLNTPLEAVRRYWAPVGRTGHRRRGRSPRCSSRSPRISGDSDWPEALLLGAVVSSTDAAAVFAVLRGSGLQLKRRVGVTLEIESGINDPVAVILTTTLTYNLLLGEGQFQGLELIARDGGAARRRRRGRAGARLSGPDVLLGRLQLPTRRTLSRPHPRAGAPRLRRRNAPPRQRVPGGLSRGAACWATVRCPIAPACSGCTTRSPGSRRSGCSSSSVCWSFPPSCRRWPALGLGVALLLACVIRPLVVALCLAPFRYPWSEVLFIGWVGLRGAVPIVLATYPVLAGAPGADRIFDLVFFIVVVNAIVPGGTVAWVTAEAGAPRARAAGAAGGAGDRVAAPAQGRADVVLHR